MRGDFWIQKIFRPQAFRKFSISAPKTFNIFISKYNIDVNRRNLSFKTVHTHPHIHIWLGDMEFGMKEELDWIEAIMLQSNKAFDVETEL